MASPPPPGYHQPPEILPPDRDGVSAQPVSAHPVSAQPVSAQPWSRPEREQAAPRPASRKGWAYSPATYILVGINCAVFVAMVLNRVSIMGPTGQQLFQWGATHPEAVLYGGQWWRVITAMFVHVGIIHLATNMWCLWNLGLLGEPLLGPFGVFSAYILSGAAGNLLSIGVGMYKHQGGVVGAGASGAVFGLAGVLIVLLKSPRLPIPPKELSALRRNVIYFAVLNFVLGFGGNQLRLGVNIDNMAHLGGFLGGILFALPMIPRIGSPRPSFLLRRRLAVGLMSCVLIFFGVYLSAVFPVPPGLTQQ
jgi:rhomboid protease GluP